MARNESRIRGKALSALGAAAGISLLSTAVQAQPAGDAPAQQTQQRAALEEVVVTARRRAENLQESPVAVSSTPMSSPKAYPVWKSARDAPARFISVALVSARALPGSTLP